MLGIRDVTEGTRRSVAADGEPGRPVGLTRSELMTVREVAELLDVPVSTVHEWGRNGTLPRVKLGRHVRFVRSRVEAAILGAASRSR
jgi:excisionase family DNA binding protein